MFSGTGTYALRALAVLGASQRQGAMFARDLAKESGVPLTYLSKILAQLTRVGVLHAVRGTGGGYRLARPADSITLRQALEPFEGNRVRPECIFGGGRLCSDADSCSAHSAWKQVRLAYLAFVEQTTVADIGGLGGQVLRLAAAPPPSGPKARPKPKVLRPKSRRRPKTRRRSRRPGAPFISRPSLPCCTQGGPR